MRHEADPPAPAKPDDPGVRPARVRIGVGAAVILLIIAAVVAVLVSASVQQGSAVAVSTGSATGPAGAPAPTGSAGASSGRATVGALLVHVTGAVKKPGLVSLPGGARVVDAVARAGGLADDADAAGVNLARPVADGEQLVVPRVGEVPTAGAGAAGPAGSGGSVAAGGAAGSVVNINTATQAELETLPRVGPALAQRILDWRQADGRFAQATDLLKVAGIAQKLFDGLKDRVVV